MKNIQCFFRWKVSAAVLATLTFFLLVSCKQGAQSAPELKDYDISEFTVIHSMEISLLQAAIL